MLYTLPTSVTTDSKEYLIRNKGDFRMILDCFNALNDIELTKQMRLLTCLIIFYEDFNSLEDIEQAKDDLETLVSEMMVFFNGGQEESGRKVNYRLIDWDKDASMVCSAINKVAGKEVRAEEYLHWWTFLGYYMAVGESALSTVVGIRSKIVKGQKLEKHEKEFRQENPQYFNWNSKSVEEQELDKLAAEMWNADG